MSNAPAQQPQYEVHVGDRVIARTNDLTEANRAILAALRAGAPHAYQTEVPASAP